MTTTILLIPLILSAIIAIVYVPYLLIYFKIKNDEIEILDSYPPISMVFAAFNEEKVIKNRIENIAQCDYPGEIELIIINDSSEDNTEDIALKSMKSLNLNGRVIKNAHRSGVNISMSKGITEANNEIVVCTDADVYFEKNALKLVVSKLVSQEDIGAVTGDLQPFMGDELSKKNEGAYRSIYGNICEWEGKMGATYCFNGALYAIKKSAPFTLNIKDGAYDAGMAFSIIRNGYKTVYITSAKVFENIPDDLLSQFRQKVRRAARLIKATWVNKDLMFGKYGKFSTVVYPLRFAALLIVPTAFIMFIFSVIYFLSAINIIFTSYFILCFILFVILGIWRSNLISTFIIHQFYLFLGLFYAFREVHIWKLTERKEMIK